MAHRTEAEEPDAARLAALEARVARLEEQVGRLARGGRRGRDIDPGDAVPPGVAVLEPEPMDAEAEAALDAIEKHIPGS